MSYCWNDSRGRRGRVNSEYAASYQRRTAWTPEEDEILKQQVARLGTHCWPDVASGLVGRTSKACSLRWRCFLSPTIIRPNEEPFSQWEIAVIVLTQRMFGNKWNDIASYLPMRCNNDIKNHFNLYLKEKQTAVSTENTFLRASYDLPSLLAVEPEEVQSRRERLDRERVASNNLELPPSRPAGGMRGSVSSYLRRATTKSRPGSGSAKYSPYPSASSGPSCSTPSSGAVSGRSGGAMSGLDSGGASPTSGVPGGCYGGAFSSLPNPHSGHSMGSFEALSLAGGGGGIPMQLMLSGHGAAGIGAGAFGFAGCIGGSTGASEQANLLQQLQQANALAGGDNLYGAGMYTTTADASSAYTTDDAAVYAAADAAAYAAVVAPQTGWASPPQCANDGMSPARRPSRLQHTGQRELPVGAEVVSLASRDSASFSTPQHAAFGCAAMQSAGSAAVMATPIPLQLVKPEQQQQEQQEQQEQQQNHQLLLQQQQFQEGGLHGQQQQQHESLEQAQYHHHQQLEQQQQHGTCIQAAVVGLTTLPSLPDPVDAGMLEVGDGDGTSLRGIFSSDDGEAHVHAFVSAARTQQQLQGSAGRAASFCIGTGISGQEHALGSRAPAAHGGAASFSAGCHVQIAGDRHVQYQRQQQQQQQPLHVDVECARGAISAPCTMRGGHDITSLSDLAISQTTCEPVRAAAPGSTADIAGMTGMDGQESAAAATAAVAAAAAEMPHMSEAAAAALGRFTPFGHPQHQHEQLQQLQQHQQYHHQQEQQQQMHIQQHQMLLQQQQHLQHLALAGIDDCDSGHSSQQHQPGSHVSPSTLAGSAAAAVARGVAAIVSESVPAGGLWASDHAAGVAAEQRQQQHAVPEPGQQHCRPGTPCLPAADMGAADSQLSADLSPLADLLGPLLEPCTTAGADGCVLQQHADGTAADVELLLSAAPFDDELAGELPLDLSDLRRDGSGLDALDGAGCCW